MIITNLIRLSDLFFGIMKVITYIIISVLLVTAVRSANLSGHKVEDITESKLIYDQLDNKSLSFEAFHLAFSGWFKLKDSLQLNENFITIIDYSQPSNEKRFYLVDIDRRIVVYNDYVAHGKNTGELLARKFSNKPNSHKSSLGFFRTAETYFGKHGLSLRLEGLETGFNHFARKRNIVIHTAGYVEESFINKYGRLGRSYGCPVLPSGKYSEVIEQIKDGTLLFIYYPESVYIKNSSVLN